MVGYIWQKINPYCIMDIYRKLTIIVIIIITSFIIYQLVQQRRSIQSITEGLATTTLPTNSTDLPEAVTEVQSMIIKDGGSGISNFALNNSLYLSQYVIKGSYNSAYSGKYMSLSAIDYVVSRGCRFLDFEVYLQNAYPIVAISSGQTITSKNNIKLFDVLNHIGAAYTPASAIAPNPQDPLFIQLRIKSQDPTIYDLIASIIQNTIGSVGNNLYSGPPITPDSLLSPLLGQMIIVIDQTVAPTYNSSRKLLGYANLVRGSTNLTTNTYHALLNQATPPPVLTPDGDNTSSASFQMVSPSVGYAANPPYKGFIKNYGVNIILMKFFQIDSNLSDYEKFFNKNKAGIVSLANSLRFIQSTVAETFDTLDSSISEYTGAGADTGTSSPQFVVNSEKRIQTTASSNNTQNMTAATRLPATPINKDLTIFTPATLDLEKYPTSFVPM